MFAALKKLLNKNKALLKNIMLRHTKGRLKM